MRRLLPWIAAALLSSAAGTAIAADAPDATAAATAASDMPVDPNATTDLDSQVRRAQTLRANGNFAEATRALSQLMLVAPDDARVVGEYGKVLAQQGRTQDALAFLQRAIQLQPNDWTLYSALGVTYDQLGQTKNARSAYDRALAIQPGEPVVLNNYAISKMLTGDINGARQMIAQAATNPDDPKITRNVAFVQSYAPAGSVPVASVPASVPVATAPASAPTRHPAVAAGVATGAPRSVVMQAVPFDPHAGPVRTAVIKHTHVAAHAVAHAAKPVAGPNVAAKKSKTPTLRMSADAT